MSEFTMLMAESALRAAVLAGLAGLAMAALRVRDASVRGAVWSAVIVASLLMPLAVWFLPPVYWRQAAAAPLAAEFSAAAQPLGGAVSSMSNALSPSPTDWLLGIYLVGAAFGATRIAFALAWGWRLRRRSRRVELAAPVEMRESEAIEVPMTFGWLRPFVVLPAAAWRDWEPRKLEAVVLHERAHIERADFLVQTLAALHEAVYWFSPLAWWLRRKVAVLAEQASDDRVLLAMNDSAHYAEVLFSFLGKPRLAPMAVPMARRGSAAAGRIDRILEEGRRLSRGTGAGSIATIAILTGVALWGASAVSLAQGPPPPPPPPPPAAVAPPAPPVPPAPPRGGTTTTWHHRQNGDSESIDLRPGRLDYERNGKRYRITDPKTLAEIKGLYAPIKRLGHEQAELGSHQAKLGAEQAALGERQAEASVETRDLDAEVAAQMDKIRAMARRKTLTQEELGEMQSRLGELQERLAQLQERAGHSQGKLGEEQGKLGSEQGRLGERQAQLGKKQAEASAKADDGVRKLIEQAIKAGRAKPVVE